MAAESTLCPSCGSIGEQPIDTCELCGNPPGCELCRCVDGDLWGGPSCCTDAALAFEAAILSLAFEAAILSMHIGTIEGWSVDLETRDA